MDSSPGLDLTPLVQSNPGGMYQLTLSFKRQHIVYACPESEKPSNTMSELAQKPEIGAWKTVIGTPTRITWSSIGTDSTITGRIPAILHFTGNDIILSMRFQHRVTGFWCRILA